MSVTAPSIYGKTLTNEIRAKYVGTAGEQLRIGEVVCFRVSNITGTYGGWEVETPSLTNIFYPAGIIVGFEDGTHEADSNGEAMIQLAPFGYPSISVEVYTDNSITSGDLLGMVPGTRTVRRGAILGPVLARSVQTVDRSSTAGLCRVFLNPSVSPEDYAAAHFIHSNRGTDGVATTLNGWEFIAASGSVVAQDGAFLLTPQATTDNASAVLHVTEASAAILATTGQPAIMDATVTFTDHNTDDGNMFFGFVDEAQTVSATVPLANDGGGPPGTYDGAGIFKVDGGTVYQAETSNGASQTTDTDIGAVSSGTAVRQTIIYDGAGRWNFYLAGALVHTSTTNGPDDHLIPAIQVKGGSGTGTPSLLLANLRVVGVRP